MKRINILLTILALSLFQVYAQQVYRTDVYNNSIKTLQVKRVGEMLSAPYIALNKNEQIEVNFDVIDYESGEYTYAIIHCDADWKQSFLQPLEYMSGFQGMPITDYVGASATTTHYMNYRLLLPNDDVQFKVSGNYAVQVFAEDNPRQAVLTACFSIVEPKVQIEAQVSSNTDIDFNQSHQQLSFHLLHKDLPLYQPETELKVQVMQNNRQDTKVQHLLPQRREPNRLIYEHLRTLIFPAGNEYRRFEFLSNKYNGMGVEDISFHNPYYHITLYPDPIRSITPYIYDQDQNGRFVINSSGTSEPDTEADYNIVHFSLPSPPILDGDVYLCGDLFHNIYDEKSKMEYNFDTECYEKAVLLKQGLYNYQYIILPRGKEKGETSPLEGDFYTAENEYTILIYYRPMGERYDRLIGVWTSPIH